MPEPAVIVVLLLVLAAEFVNGFTDAPNAIATVISTRVLRPYQALLMAVVFNVLGAMSGTAVAFTIGKGIVRSEVIDLLTVAAAMVGIVAWSTLAWVYGLPTSETHALVAGLAGAGLGTAGPKVLLWSGWQKVLLGLVFSTFLGFSIGCGLMLTIYKLFAQKGPLFFRRLFGKIQVLSSAFMAFGHGTNDGQKFIGTFTLTLVLGGVLPRFEIPLWVILLCALVMGVGTACGGWRIIRTMGIRLTRLDPAHGFAAETGAALAIQLATFLGIPLSTTHAINTAIMGVGATRRLSGVRWGVGKDIVLAWILTFPICGAIAWLVVFIAKLLGI
ncbi:MAG TPA: inorganic phosphate transporter [Armatimonadetes bacterium]|nr:inorganic phosphate transporter [Armatimonadota bacterium]